MTVAALAGVSKRFGSTRALDDASFSVEAGELVALLGPNGAGKSTALRLLLGQLRPDSGRVALFGGDPQRAETRRRVGVTPQESYFPATLRVRELLELVRAHFPRPVPLADLVERFGLAGLVGRQVGGLSGGERRRVGVALAFAGDPQLVVLDEPTTGLDVAARDAVWTAIAAHAAAGGALLLTTHHLDEADALARRVVLVERGRIVADGATDAIKAAAGMTAVTYRDAAGRRQRLLVQDGGAVVAGLVRAGVRLEHLEVRPLTLEEAIAHRGRDG
ncbi:MAG TPA: ABC transporter ATP-binding protein [Solirubrobacteraceae bacterium]|nr:ABC transporter ATP-binding protein [Solirubrobacteraceae bacterium]